MYVNKFYTFALSVVLECAGGVAYAFSLYSPDLKKSLGYTQVQIQGIANPLVPSLLLGILPGVAYDSLQRHNRLGPRLTLLIGGAIHMVGYLGLWAVGTRLISQPPYWMVVAIGVVAMNGASWTDVACVSANVRSFPMDRGTAIGILKSMMGLSASVFTTIYAVTMRPHAISFLLVIALSLPLLCLLAFPFFNAVPFRQPGELPEPGRLITNGLRFGTTYAVIGLLALLMLLTSFIDTLSHSTVGRIGVLAAMAGVLAPLCFLPLGSGGFWARPVVGNEPIPDDEAPVPRLRTTDLLQEPLLEDNGALATHRSHAGRHGGEERKAGGSTQGEGKPDWPVEMTPRESLTQLNFWLLFFIFGVGSACGLLFLNNAGQLVESLHGPTDGQDPLLALFSVFNCFGRLVFGWLPEICLHKWGTPRSAFLVGVASCMAVVTFLTGLADVSMLWLTAPISGLAYGGHWSLMPALASEFFGLSHFGLNYCLLGTSITIISFCVSNLLGGYVYQARLSEHGDKSNICLGADCFRATFLVAACLEVVAVAATWALHQRTKYIYAQEHREIVREAEEVSRCPATGHRLVRQSLQHES